MSKVVESPADKAARELREALKKVSLSERGIMGVDQVAKCSTVCSRALANISITSYLKWGFEQWKPDNEWAARWKALFSSLSNPTALQEQINNLANAPNTKWAVLLRGAALFYQGAKLSEVGTLLTSDPSIEARSLWGQICILCFPNDRTTHVKELETLALHGDVGAAALLPLFQGDSPNLEPLKAAANKSYPPAVGLLGQMTYCALFDLCSPTTYWEKGSGRIWGGVAYAKQRRIQGWKMVTRAAEKDPLSRTIKASILFEGGPEVQANVNEALDLLRSAATAGDGRAQLLLGRLSQPDLQLPKIYNKVPLPKEWAKAHQLLAPLADLLVAAEKTLYALSLTERGGNTERAITLFQAAAADLSSAPKRAQGWDAYAHFFGLYGTTEEREEGEKKLAEIMQEPGELSRWDEVQVLWTEIVMKGLRSVDLGYKGVNGWSIPYLDPSLAIQQPARGLIDDLLQKNEQRPGREGIRGELLFYGHRGIESTPDNRTAALAALRSASKSGCSRAQGTLGAILFWGHHLSPNTFSLQKLAKHREAPLTELLDDLSGTKGRAAEIAEGVRLLQAASKANDLYAQAEWAKILLTGANGITRDVDKGRKLMQQAALDGGVRAQAYLGEWMLLGQHGFAGETSQALNWLKSAIGYGDCYAMAFISYYFAVGWPEKGLMIDKAFSDELLITAEAGGEPLAKTVRDELQCSPSSFQGLLEASIRGCSRAQLRLAERWLLGTQVEVEAGYLMLRWAAYTGSLAAKGRLAELRYCNPYGLPTEPYQGWLDLVEAGENDFNALATLGLYEMCDQNEIEKGWNKICQAASHGSIKANIIQGRFFLLGVKQVLTQMRRRSTTLGPYLESFQGRLTESHRATATGPREVLGLIANRPSEGRDRSPIVDPTTEPVAQIVPDLPRAIQLLKPYYPELDPLTKHELGRILFYGAPGVPVDWMAGVFLLLDGKKIEEAELCYDLGITLIDHRQELRDLKLDGLNEKEMAAFENDTVSMALILLERAANVGLATAQFKLGRIYNYGLEGFRDPSKGEFYLNEAARGGHADARAELVRIRWSLNQPKGSHNMVKEADRQQALAWLNESIGTPFTKAIKGHWLKKDGAFRFNWWPMIEDAASKEDGYAMALKAKWLTEPGQKAERRRLLESAVKGKEPYGYKLLGLDLLAEDSNRAFDLLSKVSYFLSPDRKRRLSEAALPLAAEKGMVMLKEASLEGDIEAQALVGYIISSGDWGVEPNPQEGLRLLQQTKEGGSVRAQAWLGEVLFFKLDKHKEGLQELQAAHERQSSIATHYLAVIAQEGLGGSKIDLEAGHSLLLDAVDMKYAPSQARYGWAIYHHLWGFAEDRANGVDYLLRSVEKGSAYLSSADETWAKGRLGSVLLSQPGRREKGLQMVRSAADKKDFFALYFLGSSLVGGQHGFSTDPKAGWPLLKQAADGGYRQARLEAGTHLLFGLPGLPKQPNEAIKYLEGLDGELPAVVKEELEKIRR